MVLKESDHKLSPLCREFESRTVSVSTLACLDVPVLLTPDFTAEPESETSHGIRNDSAAYRRSLGSILINDSNFWELEFDVQMAVLAHEVGHAVCHRKNLMEAEAYKLIHECQVADLLACRWGFHGSLRKEREKSYGHRYCKALDLWQDEQAYVARMARWHQQRLAGLA